MPASIIALIHGEEGDFGISFPDLPGCTSAARTLDEALSHAAEALAYHLDGMAEDREPMPSPRTLDAIRADPDFAEEFAAPHVVAVVAYEPPGKAVRVNVTIEERLLEAIDTAAAREGSTRSGFLAKAARERLGVR